MSRMNNEYYTALKSRLIRDFERLLKQSQRVLKERHGHPFAGQIARESLQEYEALIPQIPYVGGRANPLTRNLISTTWWLAIYKAMKKHNRPTEEIATLVDDMTQVFISRYPRFLRYLIGRMRVSKHSQNLSRERALESQQRRYPGDWVSTFVEGDGKTFDYGIDFTECGIVKFFKAQGAEDFAPHMCAHDYVIYSALGIRLHRTETIAEGCTRCNFRFKWVGKIPVDQPTG